MPFVIPYFIPHQGCPHQCLFCNQSRITGEDAEPVSAIDISKDIEKTIRYWLEFRKGRQETQVAFYGGSFTCLPKQLQQHMLETVAPWITAGDIGKIRLSTRPDCIDADICGMLGEHGVGIVELGAQSFDEGVLARSERGHSVADSIRAVACLKAASISVGIQLMPGLPGETTSSFIHTVQKSIGLHPALVRLYPSLVVKDSGLAQLYAEGGYTPLSLKKAVALVCWARRRFLDAGIGVVRMGLQHSPSLEKSILAGPYHPAFGELVISREWLKRVRRVMANNPLGKVKMTISERDLSSFNGINKHNRVRLQQLNLTERLEVIADRDMERGKMHYVVC